MELKKCFTVLLLAVVVTMTIAEDATESVEIITSDEQFRELAASKSIFVMFYAPWCGHCQRLKPAWEQLASDINTDETIPVTIAKVDCTQYSKLCSDEGVTGYPTLKLYRVGEEATRHKGGRDVESLKKFLMDIIKEDDGDNQEAAAAGASHVDGLYDLTNDNFQAHIKSGYHFVKFFAPWCGHCRRLEPTWQQLAKSHENDDGVTIARVDCTEHRAICTQHGVRGYPTLMMFKDGNKVEDYENSRELKTLEAFVKKVAKLNTAEKDEEEAAAADNQEAAEHIEGLYDLDKDNFKAHVKTGLHFIKFYAPWCGHCRRLEPTWKQLAKLHENNDELTIARIDCTENKDVCTDFKVRGYPTLLLVKDGEHLEKYTSGRDLQSFKNFLSIHIGDEADEEEKEEAEEEGDEATKVDGLYVLSSSNFQAHIKSGLHLIKFYAPWCGHCRRLEPTWNDLGKFYENDDGIKIAKIDCTENSAECSKFEVRGYPTLLLIKDGKKIEKYQGGRDLEAFKKYITAKMSQPNLEPADEAKKEGVQRGITDLTDATFDDHIKSGLHFIKFYAPWCGHCRRLEPTWKELGKAHEKGDGVKIARIDCTAHSKSCSKHEVRGYPTLLLFQDGKKIDKYQGSRELDRLEDYLKLKMKGNDGGADEMEEILMKDEKPAAVVGDDVKGVLYLHATNFDFNVATDATFVMFYAPWCGFCKKLKPTWMDLSKEDFSAKTDVPVQIANVDCTKNNDLCSEYKVTGFPTLILFVEGSPRTKYKGDRSKEALFDYVISELKKKPEVEEQEPEVGEQEPEAAAQVKDEL